MHPILRNLKNIGLASQRLKNHLRFYPKRTFCQSASTDDETKKENLKTLLDNAASFEDKDPATDKWSSPVYPVLTARSQPQHSIRPQVDPRKTSVILFPGQGSQYVGMARDLVHYPNVAEMFTVASEILRFDLFDLCINGPKDMLDMTEYCQAAVMVASLAAVEKLREESPEVIENCVASAGFSVGEYSSLVFSGALNFSDAIRLLKIRGKAMQSASDLRKSGMMTVFLNPTAKIKQACAAAREWCKERDLHDAECTIAIYMFPECRVLAGDMEALKFLEINAADFGIRKMKYIPVSGAFHSRLMKPAVQALEKALHMTEIETPLISVHSNFDGKVYTDPDKIKEKLAKQLCSPVLWEQTMHILFERTKDIPYPNTYECGPGQSLKVILKQNNAKAYGACTNVSA